MKATVLQTDLNKWLNVVLRAIPSRAQIPVLANVLIEAEKDGVVLSATNLEIGLRARVGGKIIETGAITVPAKNFGEFVNSLPPGNVDLETEGDKVKVNGGKLAAVFTGIPAAEFPVMPKLEKIKEEKKTVKFKRQIIEEIASEVAFCAATDESRPVLTGVMLVSEGNKLTVTATDGFRLSRKKFELEEEVATGKGLILPARTIQEVGKILGEGKKEGVEMGSVSESNQVVWGYEGVEVTSRILEGNWPDVDKIIPTDWKCEAVADREEMLRAVRAAGIFARDSANVIRLVVEGRELRIESSSAQTGETKIGVETEQKGEEMKISFNYRYVLDFLSSTNKERVRMRFIDGSAAGSFGIEGDEALIHLIMPVRI